MRVKMGYEIIKGNTFEVKSEILVGDVQLLQESGLLDSDKDKMQEVMTKILTNESDFTIKFIETIFDLTDKELSLIKKNIKKVNVKQVLAGYRDFFTSILSL